MILREVDLNKHTLPILLLLAILVVALLSFSFEWVPPDVTALGVLLALVLTGLIPVERAFAGFGSETVMLLLGLLILTAALMRTGMVEIISRRMLLYTRNNHSRILLMSMSAVGLMSSFISNTAAAAFFYR